MTLVLDPWQEEILAYDGNILLASGRQIGKTQIFSIKCVKEMMEQPRTRIITVSLTEDQAKLIIIMVLDFLEKNGFKKEICTGNKKPTQNKIELKNGSSILARPVGTTGDALRGFTAEILFMDEVARFSDLILTAAKPILMTTGGRVWMASTFNAKQGFFWEMYSKNPKNRFKIWHKSSEDVMRERALSDTWTEKRREEALAFLESEKATMSAALYGQEYLGIPLDELRRYFDEDLIMRVCTAKREAYVSGKTYVMGNDLARMGGDQFTAEIGKVLPNKVVHVESYARRFLDTIANENEIIGFDMRYRPVKIGIDAGSGTLGVSIFDHLMQIDGIKRKIVAMNNREIFLDRDQKKKQRLAIEDYYDNLKSMMQKGEIELLDDDDVKESLRSIQLDIDDDDHHITKVRIWGTYSHHAEGITRMAWLAKQCKSSNIWIDSI